MGVIACVARANEALGSVSILTKRGTRKPGWIKWMLLSERIPVFAGISWLSGGG